MNIMLIIRISYILLSVFVLVNPIWEDVNGTYSLIYLLHVILYLIVSLSDGFFPALIQGAFGGGLILLMFYILMGLLGF